MLCSLMLICHFVADGDVNFGSSSKLRGCDGSKSLLVMLCSLMLSWELLLVVLLVVVSVMLVMVSVSVF